VSWGGCALYVVWQQHFSNSRAREEFLMYVVCGGVVVGVRNGTPGTHHIKTRERKHNKTHRGVIYFNRVVLIIVAKQSNLIVITNVAITR
jgi:hypothetical protein